MMIHEVWVEEIYRDGLVAELRFERCPSCQAEDVKVLTNISLADSIHPDCQKDLASTLDLTCSACKEAFKIHSWIQSIADGEGQFMQIRLLPKKNGSNANTPPLV